MLQTPRGCLVGGRWAVESGGGQQSQSSRKFRARADPKPNHAMLAARKHTRHSEEHVRAVTLVGALVREEAGGIGRGFAM